MKNIKKVTYIFTLFAISSNLCFPDSPLDEQDGLVFDNNDQRSIFQSFKDADNDEKAAWALTGVSALGAIFAAIGYKFYDSTKKTKSLGNFIVIKSSGKDGKPVEEIIPVYEKESDLPKNNKDKVKVGDVVFVKGEVEPESKDKDGFKNGKFLKCVNKVSDKDDAATKLLIWGEVADLSTFFGHSIAPVVVTGDLVEGSVIVLPAPAPAPVVVVDPVADPVEGSVIVLPAPVVVVDPVADPVEGSVIVPPAPADGAEEEDDADSADSDSVSEEEDDADSADSDSVSEEEDDADADDEEEVSAVPVEGNFKRLAHTVTFGLFRRVS